MKNVILLLVVLVLSACGKSGGGTPVDPRLVGTWVDSSKVETIFHADGSAEDVRHDGDCVITGHLTVSTNLDVMTVIYHNSTVVNCQHFIPSSVEQKTVLKYVIDGGALTLTSGDGMTYSLNRE
jgi:hypothetical protein